MKYNRHDYDTHSKTVEVLIKNPTHSPIPNTSVEVHKTEIFTNGKDEHDNHVTGEIFSYATQLSDQNVTIDQKYPLYAYKATSDPDT